MTVTEFSRKYGVPRAIAQIVSWNTPTRQDGYTKDVPEEELVDAATAELLRRVQYHWKRARIAEDILNRLWEEVEKNARKVEADGREGRERDGGPVGGDIREDEGMGGGGGQVEELGAGSC